MLTFLINSGLLLHSLHERDLFCFEIFKSGLPSNITSMPGATSLFFPASGHTLALLRLYSLNFALPKGPCFTRHLPCHVWQNISNRPLSYHEIQEHRSVQQMSCPYSKTASQSLSSLRNSASLYIRFLLIRHW